MNRLCLALAGFLLAPAAAAETLTLDIGGLPRTAELTVPARIGEAPRPLVIALHGLGGTGADARNWMRFEPIAERENIVVVYPDGIDKRWDYGRQINNPMPVVDGKTVDDVEFFRRLIARAIERHRVDATRVYLAGGSNGGLMAFRMACALDQELAAAAAYISGMTNWQALACRRTRPVPLLIVAGSGDRFQSYAGARGKAGVLLSVPDTVAVWRARNGCLGEREETLPDRDPDDGTTVSILRPLSCFGGAEVVFYRVNGGGHRLPTLAEVDVAPHEKYGRTNRDMETAEETWKFFARFRRN